MSEPSSGNDQRPRRSLDDETPLPGRDRYEELYRPSGADHPRGQHSLLPPRPRHFERSLQAPDQPDPDDTFGWLFRDSIRQAPAPRTGPDPGEDAYPMWGETPQATGEHEATGEHGVTGEQHETIGEHSTEETTVRPALDPTPSRLTDVVAPARRAEVTQPENPAENQVENPLAGPETADESPAEATAAGVPGLPEVLESSRPDSYLTDDVSEQARRRWPMILVGGTVGLVLVAILIMVLAFAFWGSEEGAGANPPPASSESEPAGGDEPVPEGEEPAPEEGPYDGAVAAIEPAGAAAECVADPAKDSAGKEVHYDPAMAIDSDPATAWRCQGDGAGRELVITLPEGTTVAEVGLVNGYAKKDPADGIDRYPEYRRITEATWTFADGTTVDQEFADENREPQLLRIPPVETSSVTLTIGASTEPGGSEPSRDAVLVSTVTLSAPQ